MDWRDIRNGNVIPSNHYCDQPYVVITDDCIASFYARGHFLDGGEERQFGFQRLNPFLRHFNWAKEWSLERGIQRLSVFNRALTGVEAIASLHDDA